MECLAGNRRTHPEEEGGDNDGDITVLHMANGKSLAVWKTTKYRVAGSFRGRKFSQISRKRAFHGEHFHGMVT